MKAIEISRVLPLGDTGTGAGHYPDVHFPLSKLQDCQKAFTSWKFSLDHVQYATTYQAIVLAKYSPQSKCRHPQGHAEHEKFLSEVTLVQQETTALVALAEKTVSCHQTFCEKMAGPLRTAQREHHGELTRDEGVALAGVSVTNAFSDFGNHIDRLQSALQALASSFTANSHTDDAHHNGHLSFARLRQFLHLVKTGEATGHDIAHTILEMSIMVILAGLAVLLVLHPAGGHHILAYAAGYRHEIYKWVEKFADATMECQYPLSSTT